jgi:acyl dehydratase
MTDLSVVEGRAYGPAILVPTAATTERFVAAVSDDPARWRDAAPPSFAGAVLFAVAPAFLADPDVAAHGGGVIHADQRFTWHRPFAHDVPLAVEGTVTRVRVRGDNAWVTFDLTAADGDGPVLDATSTFIVTGAAPEASEDRDEPAVHERGPHDPSGRERSASRADLVAYAAASGDLNPIHWDHDSAVAAGLPGIVCHGLLLAAWCLGAVEAPSAARVRFRSPVLAGEACTLEVADGTVTLLTDGETAVTVDVTP